ncbi:BlaI/MecI/CopY family transcriptional regulator [uncultured Gemmiger sp.]|uniref:BlaI/MecI/CopY family transcriptional regulator n=1 Tax=uncultured Gemmiger sp. TaxID=1623490 RepID=UPI0025F1E733|nr:BlaI/MecI/CopY family transcriptional regulator [uncultured Gemmiger sp.]
MPESINPADPPLLPASEEQVMAALWACGRPATRRQIAACLPEHCHWADATLLNFLARLEHRGFVRRDRQGNKNVYTPLVRRRDYCARATAVHLDTLYGGDVQQLVRTLADAGRLSFAGMESLARWLDARAAESPEYDYD